ncbi:tetratricopeptide repeat protein [Mesorhizobium sp. M2D.F.Ca.ET.185.01.1.1]|uniref:tetratricopeptide repeat protein n=1 Tax=unclassified Mesorhizobium TaxID=325217 RepID=UPI000FCA8584|nr:MULTISPECIES: tetratricopeptide repeat protein [unclassified Mesorhizobium]TGP77080.1 tetratricopeptide repeat protein [bacterium M00.F.Ca.ET.227.01.1.1]TGP84053.1 tetratricopeptide repeat protein [bacterium M00.F.Ca.ET.221.01.1.1]TGP88596.1 tetratricopeptide repeat protein [bacterium M00.F.Ca.ET.222.01.1.1]TGU03126.1 tetratricopeptide repeat protein [bacterium M00.F.Ca.ET.163.01.1.1]TGU30827.1 tetratricopeptide repeat protein [bacterium M00.F.Ca.ET.156.01.1.1]TGU45083.1 tetratricopeptide 
MNAKMDMPSPVLGLGLNGLRFGGPFFAACVLLLASMLPALAASSDCVSDDEVDQTVRIQACTRIIDDATEPARNHAIAYFKRGNVWAERHEYGRAIADFRAMIDLDPNFANGYYNRGVSWVFKGDYDKAIADFDTAIGLEPNNGDYYYNRGVAHSYKGED